MGTSLMARLFLIGIWGQCDDQGTFQWRPLTLKARIAPADNVDVDAILAELEERKFLTRYEVNGSQFGAVRNFCKFQRPKKPNYTHPIPPELRTYVGLEGGSSEQKPSEGGVSSPPKRSDTGSSSPPKPVKAASGSPPVPHQFPTGGEKPPHSRVEEGRVEEDNYTGSSTAAARATGEPKVLPLERLAKTLSLDHKTLLRLPKFATFPTAYSEWIAAGCDPEKDIWPTIEKLAKRTKNISSPRFFDTAVLEARDLRLASLPSPIETWTPRVEAYEQHGRWDRKHWGPTPDEAGCKAPAELIRKGAA